MFAYIGRGRREAGATCYNKMFLLHVRSWMGREGVGGKEGREVWYEGMGKEDYD